ncbi:RNA polymerase-associated protein RapA [Exercitatus varius]|uniref:RNA polymerase-associated protein RapA n=1 Tax=Exercitatus varius TaxID=67857 RepID=UPI00294AC6E3|nr:RNA polymerase-associated protein RapA [Exercitatus varius]MDG2943545.1 RNA polymerase-associated protein RapA [Exercitatus varius]
MPFAIGQRWISESENNLGLGMITEVNSRTVTIFFPAADETRIYAADGAPLIRVLFNAGDTVTHRQGWQAQVIEITVNNLTALYLVKRLDNGAEAVLKEMELAHQISFSKPQDRLFGAQIDRSDRFALRYQALLHQQAQFQSPLRGLRGIRAGLIPHQLHIAKEVGQRLHPRVLLADEVGLGKTIEAGMILQQQIFAGRADRVLIIVPETLQHQWLLEMLRRFNLHFSLFDEERAADFAATEEQDERNPFDSENLIICSLDWLIFQPKRGEQALRTQFDLLIVDEAHHLAWTPEAVSPEYRLVEGLAKRIPSVLLLTATPEQLGLQSHFARLKLLDADRFYDYDAFVAEQRHYRPVAEAVQTLLAEKPLSAVEKNAISDLLAERDAEPLFNALDSRNEAEKALARQELISGLIDRHGTSRVLFRNTRRGVKGFPRRVYHQINLAPPEQYIQASCLPGENPEPLFGNKEQGKKWWNFDPRVEWLITFLKNHRHEKVLVICRQAQTAVQLEQALREKEGLRSAVFHENLSVIERDRAAAYFADQENGAQVLLSSAIGSEGRNFQFACRLVLFNLPENPDLLEQCIGRLDRIGQQRDVQIYALCFADSPQRVLADWYHQGLNAFEETCPMGAALFEKCGQKLRSFLQHPTESAGFDRFLKETEKLRLQLKRELEEGRDWLLELNSNGGDEAQRLAEAIRAEDYDTELVNFALNLFDVIGVEQEDSGEKSIVITLTGTMLVPDFPGLKEDGVTVTFDRELALAREELEFLTWDHPMLCNGIDLVVSGDIGKTAASLLINDKLPPGTLLLELIYVVESQAPKGLQLNRFLPPTPLRLLLDGKGRDLAAQVSFSRLEKQLKPMDKHVANKMVKMIRPNIEKMLVMAEQQVAERAKTVIAAAQQQADSALSHELNRLNGLKSVNKNIRQDEIDGLETLRIQSLAALAKANWRLDSLRVIVSNKS